MLKRIFLKNYLTIKHLEVSFDQGLNILTGETGAGKSLILGAIEVFAQKRFPKELKKIDSEDLEIEISIQDDKKNISLYFVKKLDCSNNIALKCLFVTNL